MYFIKQAFFANIDPRDRHAASAQWNKIVKKLERVARSSSALSDDAFKKVGIDKSTLENTGYKNFFFQQKDGQNWLVYIPDFPTSNDSARYYPRNVYDNEEAVFDTIENVDKLLDFLEVLYPHNTKYTSFSSDGRYYLSRAGEDMLVLMERDGNQWFAAKTFFTEKNLSKRQLINEENNEYFLDGINWKFEPEGMSIKYKGKWHEINDEFSLEYTFVEQDEKTGGIRVVDDKSGKGCCL